MTFELATLLMTGGVVSAAAAPTVKESIAAPCVQWMSLVPPPEGPQRKLPWIPVAENESLRAPCRM